MVGQRVLALQLKRHARGVFDEVRHGWKTFPDLLKSDLQNLLDNERRILGLFDKLKERKLGANVIRTHSDYHMGQVLYTGRDFVILDFEGEPARNFKDRRRKQCPLRDVAGVLRSIHYAVTCTVFHQDKEIQSQMREKWINEVSGEFLKGYFQAARKSGLIGYEAGDLLPGDFDSVRLLIDIFVLEKALYELKYEINNRPDWVGIPLSGLLQIFENHQ